MSRDPVRVFVWGSGNVGGKAIKAVVERADMDLVGVHVTNPEKVGRDAGELADIAPTGVMATSDIDTMLKSDAGVVLHMPLPSLVYGDDPDADIAAFEAMLTSGKHVITTVGYMYPKVHGSDLVERLETACGAGGATFHGTGANPGWFGDLVPMLMTGLSLRVDHIKITEISNFQHYPSPEIMLDMMNFGTTPEVFTERSARHRHWLDGLFREAVHMVADGLEAGADDTAITSETWIADRDLDTAAGRVAAGTVAGQRYSWSATVDGKPLVTQETVWRMHKHAAPDWPHGDWSIDISGDPSMRLSLDHGWNRDVLGSTAAHAVNAVPYVVDAPAGIATFLDLPMITGRVRSG